MLKSLYHDRFTFVMLKQLQNQLKWYFQSNWLCGLQADENAVMWWYLWTEWLESSNATHLLFLSNIFYASVKWWHLEEMCPTLIFVFSWIFKVKKTLLLFFLSQYSVILFLCFLFYWGLKCNLNVMEEFG